MNILGWIARRSGVFQALVALFLVAMAGPSICRGQTSFSTNFSDLVDTNGYSLGEIDPGSGDAVYDGLPLNNTDPSIYFDPSGGAATPNLPLNGQQIAIQGFNLGFSFYDINGGYDGPKAPVTEFGDGVPGDGTNGFYAFGDPNVTTWEISFNQVVTHIQLHFAVSGFLPGSASITGTLNTAAVPTDSYSSSVGGQWFTVDFSGPCDTLEFSNFAYDELGDITVTTPEPGVGLVLLLAGQAFLFRRPARRNKRVSV